ncbi:hypothetical protein BV25DRAFT_366521 [Artomyces pyxidatus]|uniref:Uncharacterized protein n=1 Tax=Artomyces pyxidatus TaxID=48021 RepID=A0ACB8T4Z4_9AGAM|nr:hypothetical protein BV25DRAFT_366521 [Artomyces pyxidatus]
MVVMAFLLEFIIVWSRISNLTRRTLALNYVDSAAPRNLGASGRRGPHNIPIRPPRSPRTDDARTVDDAWDVRSQDSHDLYVSVHCPRETMTQPSSFTLLSQLSSHFHGPHLFYSVASTRRLRRRRRSNVR